MTEQVYIELSEASQLNGWYELDDIVAHGCVADMLIDKHGIDPDTQEELHDYLHVADYLVTDSEGELAQHFIGSHGTFDFDGWQEASESSHDVEAISAYLDWVGSWSESHFEESYQGAWNSEQDFAENLIDECYDLEKTMGNLVHYFDYESFARDLFMCDYYFSDGHVFLSC